MADNVFDKLDEQALKIDKLTERVEGITDVLQKSNGQLQKVRGIVNEQSNSQNVLVDFLLKSTKSYRWFGSEEDFNKSKKFSISIYVCAIVIGLISTILTSEALGTYTIFSFFENIMIFATCWQLGYVCKLQLTISDLELALHSTEVFKLNGDNLFVSTNKEKQRYKVSRKLCYIAIIFNIIYIWIYPNSFKSVIATIFEVIFFLVVLAGRGGYSWLNDMYNSIYFSGTNQDRKLITLVWDRKKELITKEDFERKYNFLK